MQGVVTDVKGAYVKAAIVRLLKAKDSGDGSVTVTYAETDEEGRFVIQDLNQDEKYIVEIHLESQGLVTKEEEAAEPEVVEEEEEPKPVAETEKEEPALAAEKTRKQAEEAEYEPKPEYPTEPLAEVLPKPPIEAGDEVLVLSSKVDIAEPPYDAGDPDFDDEEEAFAEEDAIIDLAYWNKNDDLTSIEYTVTENLSISSLYHVPGFNLKDKPYLAKNNLW